MDKEIILSVNNLAIDFHADGDVFQAVRGVSFNLHKGEVLGIVGESGSGKSVTCQAIMQLIDCPPGSIRTGEILFNPGSGTIDVLKIKGEQLRKLRGSRIAMIFQEPMSSLNPTHRCGKQVMEAILLHNKISKTEAKNKVLDLFDKVKLPDPARVLKAYPHELSGGQLQRVMIAMALSNNPDVLIADEPTTALDVTVQKEILSIIKEVGSRFHVSTIFISHDLGVIQDLADRVVVMRKGEIVEKGLASDILHRPKHPYTQGLINCRPPLDKRISILPTVEDFLDENNGFNTEEISQSAYQASILNLEKKKHILEVENISKSYITRKNIWGRTTAKVDAVKNVSISVYEGETLGLVGESGCGKSTLGRCIVGLEKIENGDIRYKGNSIVDLGRKEWVNLRRNLQIIFQDPYGSLNPRMKIGAAILEPMQVHNIGRSKAERKEMVMQLLHEVGLQSDHYDRYPHEFSGGQRQRICIARSLSVNPEFIICDESVSALDVSVQAQVLNLLNSLKKKYGLSLIFISHDLSVIKHISDHIAVMKDGEIVEYGNAEKLFHQSSSDYTKRLIDSIPGV